MDKTNDKKAYENPELFIEYLNVNSPLMVSYDDTTVTGDNDNPDPFD